jgi:hypothetical protein
VDSSDQSPVQVECYSGGEYAERPRALYWQGARLAVAEVLQGWRTPDGKHFCVRTRDGQVFDLGYAEGTGTWSIENQ